MWESFECELQLCINTFFSLFKKEFTNGYKFNGEVHDFWEFLYVVDGEVSVSGGERVYSLTSGDIIFHKPMELHKFSIEKDNATIFVCSFDLSGKLKSCFENSVFSLTSEQLRIISDLIRYTDAKASDCNSSEDILFCYNLLLPSQKSEIYLQRVVCYLYQLLLSLIDSGKHAHSISNAETEIFRDAVRYMKLNITEKLTVNDIAKHCGISLSGLKRTFAKFAGMSVHKYFLSLKLYEAMNLLQSGNTVSDVADCLNFSSQSSFSSTFKREIGSSPSEFKS